MRLSTTAIVLVHYGKPETTKRCLERLATVAPESLVVVSNNAGREHAEEMASFVANSLEVNCVLTECEEISESWGEGAVSSCFTIAETGGLLRDATVAFVWSGTLAGSILFGF